jgi:ATP/maltotriose-dependent transcriptional regulator MalT
MPTRSSSPVLVGRDGELRQLLSFGESLQDGVPGVALVSGRAVGVHVSRILHKLGASRRTEAADLARRAGLLER